MREIVKERGVEVRRDRGVPAIDFETLIESEPQ